VKLLRTTIQSSCWNLVCYGHTHVFSSEYQGSTLVLNPGALGRSTRPSMAVVELPSLIVSAITLDW
jgi:uncharacterized protein